MSDRQAETIVQAIRRHLRNGYIILTERGVVALFGAAMREVAKLLDSSVGSFLSPRDLLREGPAAIRRDGFRVAAGAVFRQIAATYDPPRGQGKNPVNDSVRTNATVYFYTDELTKPDGVIPSRRPINDHDSALEVPFAFDVRRASEGPVAAIVHVFYPDALSFILDRLRNVPAAVDLFLSTDSEEKRSLIRDDTKDWNKGRVDIRILPNRGRDIAAKFVGFADVYDRYPLFIHLHTKKSPHGGEPLARWRDYLLDNLLGSEAIARSNLSLFDDPKIGIVFPQHLFEIRGILNWGYNYNIARALMRRMGVAIDKGLVLEFPSGSMFWGRSAAVRPLLDIGLSFDDFPDETGQVDGTLAHAIERIVLMSIESIGYEWLKVVKRDLYPLPKTVLPVQMPDDIVKHRLKVFQPCLTNVDTRSPHYSESVQEARPVSSYPSRNTRPRLNLLIPSVNRQHTFGGISTALKLFAEWADHLGEDFDRRIVVLDADVELAAYSILPDYIAEPFGPSLDEQPRILVDAYERNGGRLNLRAQDVFVATAWWTAEIARSLESDRARYHGRERPFVYIIQDDEPNFYGWGSKYAMAMATYRFAKDTIAIINSEELFSVMTGKYHFRHAFCLPYVMNVRISDCLSAKPRERLIIVYGRRSVWRNGFELICEGLRHWQMRDPVRASRWDIIFLGEHLEDGVTAPLQNARAEGKVSLEVYAGYLSRASVGISLMFSPHPSYPPLEMAEAGLVTITNAFPGKDLRSRFPDIISMERLTSDSLAQNIEAAVGMAEPKIGTRGDRRRPNSPAFPHSACTPGDIVSVLAAEFSQ
jgi:hypothetical protein